MERCETILYTRWHLVFIHNIVLIQIMIDRIRVFIGHFFLVIDWHGRMILQVDKIKTKWMDPNSLKRTTWVKIKLYRITNIPNSIRFYLWLKKNQIFSQTFLFNEAPNFELRNSVHTVYANDRMKFQDFNNKTFLFFWACTSFRENYKLYDFSFQNYQHAFWKFDSSKLYDAKPSYIRLKNDAFDWHLISTNWRSQHFRHSTRASSIMIDRARVFTAKSIYLDWSVSWPYSVSDEIKLVWQILTNLFLLLFIRIGFFRKLRKIFLEFKKKSG